jgi:hypothetical protein
MLDTARHFAYGRLNTRPFLLERSRPFRIVVYQRVDSLFES